MQARESKCTLRRAERRLLGDLYSFRATATDPVFFLETSRPPFRGELQFEAGCACSPVRDCRDDPTGNAPEVPATGVGRYQNPTGLRVAGGVQRASPVPVGTTSATRFELEFTP